MSDGSCSIPSSSTRIGLVDLVGGAQRAGEMVPDRRAAGQQLVRPTQRGHRIVVLAERGQRHAQVGLRHRVLRIGVHHLGRDRRGVDEALQAEQRLDMDQPRLVVVGVGGQNLRGCTLGLGKQVQLRQGGGRAALGAQRRCSRSDALYARSASFNRPASVANPAAANHNSAA